MKKRLLMILAVAVLLVGCGNTDKPDTEANKPQTEKDSTTEADSTIETESTTETLETNTEEETTATESEKPHEHTYIDSVTKEATCTEAGEKNFTCECGDTYMEAIEATGHDYKDETKAPTCGEKGYTTHTCKICGNSYTDAEVSAIGHSYGKYTYNNDATYEKDGTETATCSVCGKKNTRTKTGTKLVREEASQSPDPNATVMLDDAIAYASSKYPLYQTVDNGGNDVQTYILCCTGTLTTEEVQRLNDLGTNAEVGAARLVRDRGYGNGRSTLTNLEFFGENNKFIVVKIDFSTTTP